MEVEVVLAPFVDYKDFLSCFGRVKLVNSIKVDLKAYFGQLLMKNLNLMKKGEILAENNLIKIMNIFFVLKKNPQYCC